MKKFITLTLHSGQPTVLSADDIRIVEPDSDGRTKVLMTSGDERSVKESVVEVLENLLK